jgi:2-methylcitrate dehydratase PrpD
MISKADFDRETSAAGVRSLIDWAANAWHEELDGALLRRSALILADDVSAMVAASAEPEVRAVQEAARGYQAEATVFSRHVAGRVSVEQAARGNGMAATWCELDEGVRSVPCHAGAYILPALMAESERIGLTTGQMLARLLIGYETLVRIAKAFSFGKLRSHPHGVYASLGAALGASLARDYETDELLGATSAAVTMAFASPFSHAVEGALVRNAWTAAGAAIGLLCADWAKAGIGGVAQSFHDSLVVALGAVPVTMETNDLGHEWAALEGYHKQFACCQYTHSAIVASLALREKFPESFQGAEEIERIVVETHPLGEALNNNSPQTSLAAKFSIPHAVSAAAVFGAAGPSAFNMEAVHRPGLVELRQRVAIGPHDTIGAWPEDRPAKVTWEMRDGRRHVAECRSAPGGADQPLSTQMLEAKFQTLTQGSFPQMAPIFERLLALEPAVLGEPWTRTVDRMVGRASLE